MALVRGGINTASNYRLLQASVGNDPSLADVMKSGRYQQNDNECADL